MQEDKANYILRKVRDAGLEAPKGIRVPAVRDGSPELSRQQQRQRQQKQQRQQKRPLKPEPLVRYVHVCDLGPHTLLGVLSLPLVRTRRIAARS